MLVCKGGKVLVIVDDNVLFCKDCNVLVIEDDKVLVSSDCIVLLSELFSICNAFLTILKKLNN